MNHLSMETVQRLENNNQIPIIQDAGTYFGHPNGIVLHYPEHHTSMCCHQYSNKVTEEPIDLTCNEKRKLELSSAANGFNINGNQSQARASGSAIRSSPKKRGRKRKSDDKVKYPFENINLPMTEIDFLKDVDAFHFMHNADSKKIEVLKAAKSLFSKRTRTLYHWMYPSAPKTQLKAAIAASWETLGMQEKEFYISQVLGRFGFPQSNLMINPQLGGVSGALSSIPIELSSISNLQETSNAVSTIINEITSNSWMDEVNNSPPLHAIKDACKNISRKRNGHRRRLRVKRIKEENVFFKDVEEVHDEFQDDPELSREFQQFRRNILEH